MLLHAEEQRYTSVYLNSYPQTVVEGITAPADWDVSEWLTAVGLVGVGAGLYVFDEDINRLVLDNRSGFTSDISHFGKQFGEGKYMFPAAALTALGGYIFDSDKTTDTGLLCIKSFLLANGLTTSLKFLTQRERPYEEKGKKFYNGNGFALNRDSFPSGHATVAWSIAPIIAAQYKEHVWVAPLAYSCAGFTSYSRMHDNKHWASDVFAGSLIGYFTAKLTLQSTNRLQVLPNSDAKGFSFRFQL